MTGHDTSPSELQARRILVLEDDDAVRKGIARLLERAGYRVVCASTPVEAIQIAADQEAPLDLLITDYGLGVLNGRQIAERLVRDRPRLRVLYISGSDRRDVLPEELERPGVAFLQKPFSSETLAEHVRRLIS